MAKFLIWTLKIFGGILGFFVIYVICFEVLIEISARRVKIACDKIEVGMDEDKALEIIKTSDISLILLPQDTDRSTGTPLPYRTIFGWSNVYMARDTCHLRAADGKIIFKQLQHSG